MVEPQVHCEGSELLLTLFRRLAVPACSSGSDVPTEFVKTENLNENMFHRFGFHNSLDFEDIRLFFDLNKIQRRQCLILKSQF